MNANSKRLVLVGVKHSIVAFDRTTGERVWEQDLGSRISGSQYVTLLADEERVYAHTFGEMFCLDLATGGLLWRDKLSGMGYGLASIALPAGASVFPTETAELIRQQEEASGVNTTQGSGQS